MVPIEKLHSQPKPSELQAKHDANPAEKASKPQETQRMSHEEASSNRMDKHHAWTQFSDDKASSGQIPHSVRQQQMDARKVEEGSEAARQEASRMHEHLKGKV